MKNKIITVYEHQSLTLKNGTINKDQLEALEKFFGSGVPYFSLIHQGIKFCEYVGVLQVGNTIIEILPKADKANDDQKWREILIEMLKSVNNFDVKAPSNSNLSLKSNTILELYFEIFLNEVEALLHKGLAKKYRTTMGNCKSLKGSLQFAKQISYNVIHKERFYVKYNVFDFLHPLNQILYETLKLIKKINIQPELQNKIESILLNFPEMKNIKITESLFSKIILNRKTINYSNALSIAKLLLLNYHPDITRGRQDVLALMFDMNVLWEKFIFFSPRATLHPTPSPERNRRLL